MVVHGFLLEGQLDTEALWRSFAAVCARHGNLRTICLAAEGQLQGEPLQAFKPDPAVALIPVGSRAQIEQHALRVIADLSDIPVEPSRGPWLRVRLIQLGPEEHWFVLAVHRLIADCVSIDQVMRETCWLYAKAGQECIAPLATQAAQYANYASWQARTAQEWLRRHGGYWQTRLHEAVPIKLGAIGSGGGAQASPTGTVRRSFGGEVSKALKDFARSEKTLAANVMLAIYVAVLWRWSQQSDFVIALKVAGRRAEHKYTVGHFSHIIYLRMQLSTTLHFCELVDQVSSEFYRALSHQDFGLISCQRPELLTGAFFQWITRNPEERSVMYAPSGHCADLVAKRLPIGEFGEGLSALPEGMATLEITFFDTLQDVYASGVYRTDVFTAERVETFMDQLEVAIALFLRDPRANVR